MLTRTLSSAWRRQEFRFLVTGGFNTAVGFLVSAGLFHVLSPVVHYVAIMVICTVVNITISYITNKLIVFRTRGNVLAEYARFYAVSAVPIGLNFVLFPLLYGWMYMNPYFAMALITAVTVVISYVGHRHVSFKS